MNYDNKAIGSLTDAREDWWMDNKVISRGSFATKLKNIW